MSQIETETRTSFADLPVLEPPAPSVGSAVRRHPWIVVLCVLVCVGAGAAVGLVRKPTFSASAKLQVGGINLNAPGALSGLQTASETLAASYSRAIVASGVVGPVASQMHLSPSTVMSALSASPVPLSSNFTVTGISKRERQAVLLANSGAKALVAYITALNRSDTDAQRLYGQLKTASTQVEQAKEQAVLAEAAVARSKNNPTRAEVKALVDAQSAVDAASSNLQALRQTYVSSLAAQASTNTAQLVTPATAATSDKSTKLEIFLFAGLVAGLLIGAALATLYSRRSVRRRAVVG